mmetsp:Transcript_15001/g.38529  ORF Transcript_15001/g.38529 Transcript_15001/m.38529 type:complete len:254 (+) Transcript_15001:929-1690(+)
MKMATPNRATSDFLSRSTRWNSRLVSHVNWVTNPGRFPPCCSASECETHALLWATSFTSSASTSCADPSHAFCTLSRLSVDSVCAMCRTKSAGLYCGGHSKPSAPKCRSSFLVLPPYSVRPWASRIALSNAAKISDEGWWITDKTVHPSSASFLSNRTTSSAAKESSPEVGSSRKMVPGWVMSSIPMEHRLRSPPEMPRMSGPPTSESAHFCSFNCVIIRSTSASISSRAVSAGSRSRAENSSASRTVTVAKM